MLGEVPKLFGRSFIIGFLLPSAVFIVYLVFIARLNPLTPAGQGLATITVDVAGRMLTAAVITALLLLLLNRFLVRILEGYGAPNPFRLATKRTRARFDKLAAPVLRELADLEAAWARGETPAIPAKFTERLARAARTFPHQRDKVLPTRFGNAYRAFEAYPLVVYGMDAVVLWPRLMCVVPETANEQLRDARSLLDFYVNLFWLSFIAFAVTAATRWGWPGVLAAAPALGVAILTWIILPSAVQRWGSVLASMFDLYRQPLAAALGLELPDTPDKERVMWREATKMMMARSSYSADRLGEYRLGGAKDGASYQKIVGDLYWRRPEE